MVFWPQAEDKSRRTQAMNTEQLLALASRLPVPDGERDLIVDIRKVGIVARLRNAPMKTDADGIPTVSLVLQITGKSAVNSLPIEDIRDMLGEDVLIQINGLQVRFELGNRSGREGGQ